MCVPVGVCVVSSELTMMQTSFLVAFLAGASGNALHDAIQADDIAMLTKHIDGGLEINEKGQGGQTPLMMAVLSGKTSAVEVLLSRGADTSIGEQDGCAPRTHPPGLLTLPVRHRTEVERAAPVPKQTLHATARASRAAPRL